MEFQGEEPELSIRRRHSAASLPHVFQVLSNQLVLAERQNRFNLHFSDVMDMCGGMRQRIVDSVLRRLVSQGRLFRPSRGHDHWVVVPADYQDMPAPPVGLWLDHFCRITLNTPYYVLDYHPVTQPSDQDIYIVSPERRHCISSFGIALMFLSRPHMQGVPTHWVEGAGGGGYRVSSPAVTALDLLHYRTRLGGRDMVRSQLRQLIPSLTENDLRTAAQATRAVHCVVSLRAFLIEAGHPHLAECLLE